MNTPSPIGRPVAADRRRRASESSAYRAELDRIRPFEEAARHVIRLRMDHQLTQDVLAQRVGTTKSAISRLESGQHAPNLATLQRIAAAFGGHIVISFDIPEASPTAKQKHRQLAQV